jgi:hypothetical protein
MEVITVKEAVRKIFATGEGVVGDGYGQTFSVVFRKRTPSKETGRRDLRTMNCRLGSTTKKGLAGGHAAYDPGQHGLIWVYLMAGDENRNDSKNRRSIPIEGLRVLSIGGEVYAIEQPQ